MSERLAHETVGGLPFLKVLGSSELAGRRSAKLYTYSVYVEESIKAKRFFADAVHKILSDPRGWIRGGEVSFKRVDKGASTQVVLARPKTVDKLCAPLKTEGEVSCQIGSRVVINYERWMHAVPHWDGTINTYRQMVVNHEWGHRQSKGHAYCAGPGEKAPVMMQQTYGLGECIGNPWPLESEL